MSYLTIINLTKHSKTLQHYMKIIQRSYSQKLTFLQIFKFIFTTFTKKYYESPFTIYINPYNLSLNLTDPIFISNGDGPKEALTFHK